VASQPLSLGFIDPWSTEGDYNVQMFAIQAAISKLQTATVVRVERCSNSGGLSPIGTVDVTPLVAQVDGFGRLTPHGTVFGLPYLRLSSGPVASSAIQSPAI
jgi:hypothetical protein